MRNPAGILVRISCLSFYLKYHLQALLLVGATALPQPESDERSYVGVLSDFDYRKWDVERVEGEVVRILKVNYNQLPQQGKFYFFCSR